MGRVAVGMLIHAPQSRIHDLLQYGLRSKNAHLLQRLTHSGQPRILEGSALNVVEAYDRDVLRHAQPCLSQSSYRSNR